MYRSGGPLVSALIFNVLFWPGLLLLAFGGLMIYSSKVGKVRMSGPFVADLHLRGDETVLDAGCGRGLLLIASRPAVDHRQGDRRGHLERGGSV